MEAFKKRILAAPIMSLAILASLILVAKTSILEAVIILLVLLAVFAAIDFTTTSKLFSPKQARAVSIVVGIAAITGIGLWGAFAGTGTPIEGGGNPELDDTPSATVTDEAYDLGLFYFERGEYEKAIQALNEIANNSGSYVEAQKLLAKAIDQYRTGLIDTANTYVKKDDYKLAIEILKVGLLVIPEDAELMHTIEDYSSEYTNTVRATAIAKAETYAAAQNYANALVAIRGAIDEVGGDAELEALSDKYAAEYRNDILAQSESLLYDEGYEAAIQLIQSAFTILPNDREFANTIAEYEEYAPAYLIEDIDYLTKDDGNFGGTLEIGNDALTDNDGNTIIGHYHFHNTMTRNWASSDHAFITFDLSSQFKSFSGTLILPEEHKHTAYSAFVYVYGDDKLLYTSPPITAGFHTDNFSVDVSDVSILTIEMANDSGIGSDWVVGYLTNAYLSKLTISSNETAD